jgi:single-strand DNA-binding protein
MDLNRATILGRLTRDPEVRSTPSGRSVANMTVATNRVWKDQSGAKQEKSEFHNCVLWGKIGEIAGQYMTKGKRVYIEGRIETRDWTGQDGVKKYRTEIIVDNMIMLDGARGGGGQDYAQSGGNDGASSGADASEEEISVEDIPF